MIIRYKVALALIIVLLIVTWSVTIWLFYYLTDPGSRSESFGLTLRFVCFLEFLLFGYFCMPLVLGNTQHFSWPLYPAIGIILVFYVVVSLAIIIDYNGASLLINSYKRYTTGLAVESLIFLVLVGSIIVLNIYVSRDKIRRREEGRALTSASVRIREIHRDFVNCRQHLEAQAYRDIEFSIRKLKERFDFCTPFGRGGAKVGELEERIERSVSSIAGLVAAIPSAEGERLQDVLQRLRDLTSCALLDMEQRERLLVR